MDEINRTLSYANHHEKQGEADILDINPSSDQKEVSFALMTDFHQKKFETQMDTSLCQQA